MVKCIKGRSIKIVQSFAALLNIEDIVWASVYEYGKFVVSVHGNSELNGNID